MKRSRLSKFGRWFRASTAWTIFQNLLSVGDYAHARQVEKDARKLFRMSF